MDSIFTFIRSATARLTLSYLVIIMGMSIGFSVIFYNTSLGELERQVPPRNVVERFFNNNQVFVNRFFEDRLDDARAHLLLNLAALNGLTLLGGAGVSYLLARKTLQPIERAMESQSRFTLDASHELRTPLAAIQVENEVALRNKQLTVDRAKELLKSNVEEVVKLRDLADGLLRLARDETPQHQPVEVTAAADEAMHRVMNQAAEKSVKLEQTVPALTVIAEATSLVQILSILLDNAVKYSAAGTTVTLTAERQGSAVLISVSDQGPGIEPDEQERIFDRFYRADQSRSRRHVEGYGLGLSIARKLTDQINGTISVKSPPGQGATFTIRLPYARPPKTAKH